MVWQIKFSQSAFKDLSDLDKPAAIRIRRFLLDRLAQLDDPRSIGQALKGTSLGNYWKYRVEDYRVIATIEDSTVRILVVRIGNRKDVYR